MKKQEIKKSIKQLEKGIRSECKASIDMTYEAEHPYCNQGEKEEERTNEVLDDLLN
jgi:hypothetical protein